MTRKKKTNDGRGPKPRPMEERFWEKVSPEPNTGCWLWTGSTSGGYGRLMETEERRLVAAHRFSYELHFGDPGDLQVCHHCDTPACVNPQHFFLGTQSDNVQDCLRKGRAYIGGAPQRTHCRRGHPLRQPVGTSPKYCPACMSKARRQRDPRKTQKLYAKARARYHAKKKQGARG